MEGSKRKRLERKRNNWNVVCFYLVFSRLCSSVVLGPSHVFCLIFICAHMYSESRHMFVLHISIFTIIAVLLFKTFELVFLRLLSNPSFMHRTEASYDRNEYAMFAILQRFQRYSQRRAASRTPDHFYTFLLCVPKYVRDHHVHLRLHDCIHKVGNRRLVL